MEIATTIITLDYLKEHYEYCFPSYPTLRFVDYRDSLDYRMKEVAEAVSMNDFHNLELSILDDWDTFEAELMYWEEFKKSLLKHHNSEIDEMSDDEFKEALNSDELFQEFREWLWDNDDSGDVVKQLMDKTDNPGCFYDLNVEFSKEPWCMSEEEIVEDMKEIAKALHLDWHNKKVRDTLYELRVNATYGGFLRIYFNAPIWDLVSEDEHGYKYGKSEKDDTDYRSIIFNGTYMIGIIDPYNGSGMVEDMKLNLQLEFVRSNLRISKLEKYSYEEVFGAYSDYEVSDVVFSYAETEGKITVNEDLAAYEKREAQYNKTFKAGGCTCGDEDMRRHRDVYYDNNFPAGNHCPHCGMFWVD